MSVTAELADGRRLEFPDGTSPEIVKATVKRVLSGNIQKQPGMMDRLKGAGEAALSVATGAVAAPIGAVTGLARSMVGGNLGTQAGVEEGKQRAEEVSRKFTYEPRTQEGKDILGTVGKVFDESKLAGLGPMAVSPEVTAAAQATRPAVGYAAKVLGQEARDLVPMKPLPVPTAADIALSDSRKLGYVVPPSSAPRSGVTSKAVEGLVARTAPTERVASVRNAQVTNRLVAGDFGITPGKAITDETFGAIRKEAGKSYQAVKNSGVPIKTDKTFEDALQTIRSSDYGKAAAEYGEILGNEKVDELLKGISKKEVSSGAAVEMTKELRRRATKNIKAWDDLERQDLGYAQRATAQALEDLIDRNLTAAGKKGLVSAWQQSRKTIAKSYDAEAAWDGTNFSAKELAKMAKKGKPLEGGMLKAAEFARHFPKAAQDVTKMAQKSGFSQYDMWGGLAGALATGHPEALAIAGVPWLTQRALLSETGQGMFAKPVGLREK